MEHRRLRSPLASAVTLFTALAVAAATASASIQSMESGDDAAPAIGVMQDNVVVLLDASGSMKERLRRGGERKMDVAKEALAQVIREVPDTTNVGLLVFGGGVKTRWLHPLAPIDRATFESAIERPRAAGGTPLGEFMKIASDALLEQRQKQYGYGSYRLLVVTDGEATDPALLRSYVPDILSRGITVDVIGVDMAADHTLATRVHSYRKADDPESFVRAVAEVFGEVGLDGDDATTDAQFALVAAIPDGMALSMIQALARSGNHPIGQRPDAGRRASRRDGSAGPSLPPAPPGAGATPTSGPPATKSGSIPFFLIIVMVVVGVIVLKVVIKAVRLGGGSG